MIFLSVLAHDTLAKTLNNNPIEAQTQLQNNIDKQIEDYYNKLIAIQGYAYMDLFKKLRKEKKAWKFRSETHGNCVKIMVEGKYPIGESAIDILIIVFWYGEINKDIENEIMEKLSEKYSNIFFIKQLQENIQASIKLKEKQTELKEKQTELKEKQTELKELKEFSKNLESINQSLEWFRKLFKEKQQK